MGGRKTPLSSFPMDKIDAVTVMIVIAFVSIVVAADALERYFKKNP